MAKRGGRVGETMKEDVEGPVYSQDDEACSYRGQVSWVTGPSPSIATFAPTWGR